MGEHNPRARVVITGMSINTGLGDTLEGFRDALYEGRSSIRRWRAFPTDRVYSKIGGDISDYDVEAKVASLEAVLPGPIHKRLRKLVARAPWTTKLSMLLGTAAWHDAGLTTAELEPDTSSVVVSGHNSVAAAIAQGAERSAEQARRRTRAGPPSLLLRIRAASSVQRPEHPDGMAVDAEELHRRRSSVEDVMSSLVEIEREDGIAIVTMNDAAGQNALGEAMVRELGRRFARSLGGRHLPRMNGLVDLLHRVANETALSGS
ncbi:MAG: hypothetical protein J0I07_38690 [Myxococcales bacterium]|nr:hypothetical protein [Myxococcales bacterium]